MKITFLLLILAPTVFSFNFLVFCPLFGHSHTTFFAKVADTLSDAGHNVTFFTPTVIGKYTKVQYVRSTKDVIHLEPSKKLAEFGAILESEDTYRFWRDDSSISEILPTMRLFTELYLEQANVLRDNLELLEELKAKKFDAMIFESFVTCGYALYDYLEIPTLLPATSILFDPRLAKSIGEPMMPSTVPLPLTQSSDRMSLFERLSGAIAPPIFDWFLPIPEYKSFRAPHNVIDVASLEPHASFVFTNSNPFIEYPRPVITKNVQIGGISVDVEKLKSEKVDEEWDTILNLRKKSVLVSFGSIMLSMQMPLDNKKSLISAMKQFPDVTFIWKYEGNDTETFANGVDNVHFSRWVPQTALLADPRLSAFFTHAGLGSVNELSYLGKPAVLCPLFADQMRNAKMLARHNGSIELSKYDLAKPEKVEEVLKKILNEKTYTLAAQNLALQLEKQPIKPKELLVKYAEFAAQFGRLPSLDPYSRQMPFFQYFLIDVAFIIAFWCLLMSYVFLRLARRLLSRLPFTFSARKQKTN